VHGNSFDYGELAYLTGFVPKLGPALAMVPRQGAIRLLVSGSSTMLPAAKKLTWVKDIGWVGNLRSALADWLGDGGCSSRSDIGLWGRRTMTGRLHSVLESVIQPMENLSELTKTLDNLRLRKSPRELELLREAARILGVACREFTTVSRLGGGARTAILAAERAAFHHGAQDMRSLASVSDGGPPVVCDSSADLVVDPLLACIAIRFSGYWAQGLITYASNGEALACGQQALAAMIEKAREGITFEELKSLAASHLSSYALHPFLGGSVGNSIGLSLEELQPRNLEDGHRLREGGVYVLRAGAAGTGKDNAVVSAMVAVNQGGIEVLWSALGSATINSSNRDSL
jgi:Xaa-Pro aminopeptidase